MIIDSEARRRAAEIVAWASAHPYHVGDLRPCDDAHALVVCGDVRCTYSTTIIEGRRHRCLTMRVEGGQRYVHPRIARAIATQLFGFTSHARAEPDPTWVVALSDCEHAVVVIAQPEERPS